MSDRKRIGWRADNPNRHKREVNPAPEISLNHLWSSDDKRKNNKEKIRRRP